MFDNSCDLGLSPSGSNTPATRTEKAAWASISFSSTPLSLEGLVSNTSRLLAQGEPALYVPAGSTAHLGPDAPYPLYSFGVFQGVLIAGLLPDCGERLLMHIALSKDLRPWENGFPSAEARELLENFTRRGGGIALIGSDYAVETLATLGAWLRSKQITFTTITTGCADASAIVSLANPSITPCGQYGTDAIQPVQGQIISMAIDATTRFFIPPPNVLHHSFLPLNFSVERGLPALQCDIRCEEPLLHQWCLENERNVQGSALDYLLQREALAGEAAWHYVATPLEQYASPLRLNFKDHLQRELEAARTGGRKYHLLDIGIGAGTQWTETVEMYADTLVLFASSLTHAVVTRAIEELLGPRLLIGTTSEVLSRFPDESLDMIVSHFGVHSQETMAVYHSHRSLVPKGHLILAGENWPPNATGYPFDEMYEEQESALRSARKGSAAVWGLWVRKKRASET